MYFIDRDKLRQASDMARLSSHVYSHEPNLTVIIAKNWPSMSRIKISAFAAAPLTLAALAYLVEERFFAGDPADWEGLTYALAPVIGIIVLGLLQLIGMAVAAIVMHKLCPQRGYIE